MPIRKSSVSSAGVPSGTTADRPTDPSIGDTFFNGTLGVQEIYTSSGWLPATGANDFNVVLAGSETSVTLDKEYFSGAYTITSSLADTSFDIYLFDTQGNPAGYTKSPSVSATANFNKIVVLGGQDGDLLSFAYKTTFTTTAATDEVTTGPVIKSISVTDLPNIEDTTVITGVNFAENVEVTFTGTNDVALSAKSVVRSSATSLIVTRPDTLIEDHSPYTVTVTNPGVTPPTGSNGHISTNSITAGGDPTWSTTAGELPVYDKDQPYSTSLSATDPDGGPITYSIVSGELPPGLSLNSSTGEIFGTPTAYDPGTFTVSAIDSGGNVTNRSFIINPNLVSSLYGVSGVVGYYTGDSFGEGGTRWRDLSSGQNHATEFKNYSNIIKGTSFSNENGVDKTFTTIYADVNGGVRFPAMVNLNEAYTLFHVARYSGNNSGGNEVGRARIFDGEGTNWLSGFWSGNAGVAYHGAWLTTQTDIHGNNWVLSTDQKNLYRSNGATRSNNSAGTISSETKLSINYGSQTSDGEGEQSNWAVAEVIIFDRELTSSEYQAVEAGLKSKYGFTY